MTERLALVAGSGLAREVMEAVRAGTSYDVVAVFDDDPGRWGSSLHGVEVVGPVEAVTEHPDVQLLLCAGAGASRAALEARLASLGAGPDRYATVIHPRAVLSPSTVIGAGSVFLAGTVATADVTVGRHVVVMPNAVLTHDDVLDDYVTVCAGVALAGNVHVGAAAYLGAGSLVRENCTIGAGSTLGLGAAAVSDVPADEVWVGTPARRLRTARQPERRLATAVVGQGTRS